MTREGVFVKVTQFGTASILAIAASCSECSGASANASGDQAITDLSLEDLMKMEVTSAAKKAQKLSDVAAAIHVITSDEIRRSGVTSIPEALRLAPGINVARIDSSKWAISARGFNGRFANKLLVLMDGRSVYNPTFSGVYWEVQDTVLEDIDRIEVIRGPGATLWGANAVNGVINIITKQATKTQGTQLSGGGGNLERAFGVARHGFKAGENTHARLYFKGTDRQAFATREGRRTLDADDWNLQQGGFRLDHDAHDGQTFTLQGDAYRGVINQISNLPSFTPPNYSIDQRNQLNTAGWNLLGRWRKALDLGSEMSWQFYYDHTERQEIFLQQMRDTFDLDFQHRFAWGESQDIIWGGGYRYSQDELTASRWIHFDDSRQGRHLFSFFLQDELLLIPEELKLTIGVKVEHNDFTGFEVQPSGRLAWTPSPQHALWASVSRAVRTPSRAEDEANVNVFNVSPGQRQNPTGLPIALFVSPNKREVAEELLAIETGYRYMPRASLFLDSALFYHIYDHIRSNDAQKFGGLLQNPVPHVVSTTQFNNSLGGTAYGAEFLLSWQPYPWWTLQATYTYLHLELHQVSARATLDHGHSVIDQSSAQQQWSLRTGFDLPGDIEADFWLRYVDPILSGFPDDRASIVIPAYVTLDARLGWKINKHFDISLMGQNLLDSRHPEFVQETLQRLTTEVPRGFYLKALWRF